MGFFDAPRVPQPEVMADEAEAETYASAPALRHLDALDDEMVERALALGITSGSVLDLGTGTGQIPIKLAVRNPDLLIHAVDLSDAMLRKAAMDASRWGVGMRILFDRCDATDLPFDPGLFDMVLCNSLLHHVADPVRLIREMDRVCRPGGALLLSDLRRPNRLVFGMHLRKHGCHYSGTIRATFEASVRAAYTCEEVETLVRQSGVAGIEVMRMGEARLGFVRPRP